MGVESGQGPARHRWDHAVLAGEVALIGALYYLVPLEGGGAPWQLGARWTALVLGAALIGRSVVRAAVLQARADPAALPLRPPILLAACGIALFALADHGLALFRPGEFEGLETRTDALYFALTTLATVGYGDIHAQGQWARGLLIGQMVFNVAVVAGAVSLVTSRLQARARRG
ncbi:potassium channel family protein [Nocardiopsis dassonvillei]|uniref:potassium channel family protein n=1 Tax=Nocardiopsis dassonvillei TaxID=2014 RepID=UPI003F5783AA